MKQSKLLGLALVIYAVTMWGLVPVGMRSMRRTPHAAAAAAIRAVAAGEDEGGDDAVAHAVAVGLTDRQASSISRRAEEESRRAEEESRRADRAGDDQTCRRACGCALFHIVAAAGEKREAQQGGSRGESHGAGHHRLR